MALTAGGAVAAAARGSAYQSPPSSAVYAYVGSTTMGPFGAGGGGGIHVIRVNISDGALTLVSQTGADMDGLVADGLCISRNGRFLYAVNERRNLDGKAGAGGGVSAFAINPANGALTHLNTQLSMGSIPLTSTSMPTVHGSSSPITVRAISRSSTSSKRAVSRKSRISMTMGPSRCLSSTPTEACSRRPTSASSKGNQVLRRIHSRPVKRIQ